MKKVFGAFEMDDEIDHIIGILNENQTQSISAEAKRNNAPAKEDSGQVITPMVSVTKPSDKT